MSYWDENPHIYEEVCCRGIVRKLLAEVPMDLLGTAEQERALRDQLEAMLLSLADRPDFRQVYLALRAWAHREIQAAEEDYFADLQEQVRYYAEE